MKLNIQSLLKSLDNGKRFSKNVEEELQKVNKNLKIKLHEISALIGLSLLGEKYQKTLDSYMENFVILSKILN